MSAPDVPTLVCSQCGYRLEGPPEEEIDDIDGDHNPDDPHFEEFERGGHSDTRLRCNETGQMAGIEPQEEYDGPGSEQMDTGGPGDDSREQTKRSAPPSTREPDPEVFSFDEDKKPEDILIDVAKNPSYGLSDAQVGEIKDWADIYDGQMSPDLLENVLKDMKGVSKQQAGLMSRKYEARMNKYAREVAAEDSAPPIGASGGFFGVPQTGGTAAPQRNIPKPPQSPSAPDSPPSGGDSDDDDGGIDIDGIPDDSGSPSDNKTRADLRSERKMRRLERRDEAMETMMSEAAESFAQENAKEFGKGFLRMRDIFMTLLEKKAEKDPEAFFQLMEKYDIDILEFFAEDHGDGSSDGMGTSAKSPVDEELDDIGDELSSAPEDHNAQKTPDQQRSRPGADSGWSEYDMDSQATDTEQEQSDDEAEEEFNDLFGDAAVEEDQ